MTTRQARPLDLIGLPLDLGAARRGAAAGPDALRAAGLPDRLRAQGWSVRDEGDLPRPATDPEVPARPGSHHFAAVAAWTQAIHDRAHASIMAGHLPIFMGGDHSVSMGTVSGVARACRAQGRALALLWLDAHADFNTPATSSTGNLHGMAVAFLAGDPSLRALLRDRPFVPIPPDGIALLGLRDVDPAEQAALDASGIHAMPMAAWRASGLAAALDEVLARIDPATTHLHVSLDLDVVDPRVAPGVGTGVPNGLSREEARLMSQILGQRGRIGSLDLVELDPMLDPSGRSAAILAELAVAILA